MRAQTTIDFAIGISIFLLVVVYVLAFVPGMLEPFVESQNQNTIVADRAADQLTQGMLGSAERPFMLGVECTVAFFGGPDPGDCRFDATATPEERLGLVGYPPGTGPNLQVEIRGNVSLASGGVDTVCWDADADQLVEADDTACSDPNDTVFEIGDDLPTQQGVVVSRRVVSIDDTTATVFVRVW